MKHLLKVIPLHTNEKTLIQEAAKNNKEAQHYIFNRYASKMLSVCRYYISDIHYAEDVMITAFYKVFTHLKSFKHKGSFEGWIRKIMVREAISFLRRKNQFVYIEDQTQVLAESIADTAVSHVSVDDIQTLIDDLADGYKTIFLMYAVEGYSHKEIAAMLNISESTSKSQLYKARKILQEKLTKFNKKENGTR